MTDKVPILVVLGTDIDGKPHGSRFEERDAPFVARAAELMVAEEARAVEREHL